MPGQVSWALPGPVPHDKDGALVQISDMLQAATSISLDVLHTGESPREYLQHFVGFRMQPNLNLLLGSSRGIGKCTFVEVRCVYTGMFTNVCWCLVYILQQKQIVKAAVSPHFTH